MRAFSWVDSWFRLGVRFEVATLEPNRRRVKAPGARRFVAQNGFCSTKTHLARPLGRVSEKKVRLPKVFQFGGKVRAALFVGKTFVFNRKPRRGSPRKPLYIAVFVQLFICVVTHLLTCNCISE